MFDIKGRGGAYPIETDWLGIGEPMDESFRFCVLLSFVMRLLVALFVGLISLSV